MMEGLRAVFFDAFGTILNSEGLHVRATEIIIDHLGLRGLDARELHDKWDEYLLGLWSRGDFLPTLELFGRTLKMALAYFGFDIGPGEVREALGLLVEFFEEGTRPYDDVEDVMDFCRSLGLKVGIISDADAGLLRALLSKHGLMDYLDALIISDEVGFLKPDERIFSTALSKVGCRAREALMVGDSLRDVRGARRAGMRAVLLLRPTKREPPRWLYEGGGQDALPDAIVEGLRGLKGIVLSLTRARGPKPVSRIPWPRPLGS